MSTNTRRALRDALIVVIVASAVLALGVTIDFYVRRHGAASRDESAQAENQQAVNDHPLLPSVTTNPTTTTVPATTVTTTLPPTTAAPATTEETATAPSTTTPETTTPAFVPQVPTNDELNARYNDVGIGIQLDVPDLLKGPWALTNADMTALKADGSPDAGHTALTLGPALFLSKGYSFDGVTRSPTNDYQAPGSGGKVVIGAHRTTRGPWAPFENIGLLQPRQLATIGTTYGVFTYEVMSDAATNLAGCQNFPDDNPTFCRTANTTSSYYGAIDSSASPGETLFLFSCDDRGAWRLVVQLRLITVEPPVAP